MILHIYDLFCRYLKDCSVAARDFNSYGSRRGNDAIMSRGTFANIRLVNKLNEGGKSGPKTLHIPSNKIMDVFDAAKHYIEVGGIILHFCQKNFTIIDGVSKKWSSEKRILVIVLSFSHF